MIYLMSIITAASIRAEGLREKGFDAASGLRSRLCVETLNNFNGNEMFSESSFISEEYETISPETACILASQATASAASAGRTRVAVAISLSSSDKDLLSVSEKDGSVCLNFHGDIKRLKEAGGLCEQCYGAVRGMFEHAGCDVNDFVLSAGDNLPIYTVCWLNEKDLRRFAGDPKAAADAISKGVPVEDVLA